MDEPTLIAFCTDVMQAALNRDAYSGWGIRIFTLGPNGINVHDVPCRMDWIYAFLSNYYFLTAKIIITVPRFIT